MSNACSYKYNPNARLQNEIVYLQQQKRATWSISPKRMYKHCFLLSKLFTAFSYINSYYRASNAQVRRLLSPLPRVLYHLPILLSYRLLYKVHIIMLSTKHSPHKKTITGLEASTGGYQNDMQCSIVRRKLQTKGKQLAV